MKHYILAALGAAFLTSGAVAADLRSSAKDSMETPIAGTSINWTGFHIGAQVGHGTSQHNLDASASGTETTTSAFVDGIGGNGAFAGGSVGFDYARGSWLVGVFGDYNFSEAESNAGLAIGGNTIGTASIKGGDSWMVGARAGYLFGTEKRAMLYALAGYGQTDVDYAVTGTDGKSVTFDSFVFGIGGEYALTNNMFIGLEARRWVGDDKTIHDDDGLKITDDFSKTEVMARLRLKLNSGLIGY